MVVYPCHIRTRERLEVLFSEEDFTSLLKQTLGADAAEYFRRVTGDKDAYIELLERRNDFLEECNEY